MIKKNNIISGIMKCYMVNVFDIEFKCFWLLFYFFIMKLNEAYVFLIIDFL